MSLRATVAGVTYTRAIGIRVSRDIRNFVGSFEIVSSPDRLSRIPIKINDLVEIYTEDGERLIKGYIEKISVRYGPNGHEISASGRDVTADLVDSTIRKRQYKGPISFDGLVNAVMSAQKAVFPLLVRAEGIPKIEERENISAEIGEPVFSFLDRYARRVGVVLTSGPSGEILIFRSGSELSFPALVNVPGDLAQNVITSDLSIDFTQIFSEYSCLSQLPTHAGELTFDVQDAVDQRGVATDSRARPSRFFEFEAETPMDARAAQDRAGLESNLAASRAFSYRASLQGIQAGIVPNTLIDVRDIICDVQSQLLVSRVSYEFSLGSGSVTSVDCTLRGAYDIEAAIDALSDPTEQPGEEFTL